MSIVCGIDFSPSSSSAARLAGRLAQRLGEPLAVVHVIDLPLEGLFAPWRKELEDAARLALDREVDQLRSEGVSAEAHLLHGRPDEELTSFAQTQAARMIVIAALGTRSPEAWQVGGSADRITQLATCPVLVMRKLEPFTEWLDGKRPLRILLGMDRTEASRVALDFVSALRRVGPCDVTLTHLYWAPDEYRRLGFAGIRSIVEPDPNVQRILHDEIAAEVGALPGDGATKIHLEPCLGRPSDRLVALARESEDDLVVVGSHHRNLLDRVWNGSVSRSVLHAARTNVARVPSAHAREMTIPEIRSVLVATDFSDIANGAIRWAYGLARGGGVVHLVTVHSPALKPGPLVQRDIFGGAASPADEAEVNALRHKLEALQPASAERRDISTRVHVLTSDAVGPAICQAAERLEVDTVVVGTHGRTGIVRAMLGSVAQDVVSRCARPVMVVRPPESRS
ncbi:MAG: universal stress protein [Myxococcaceae bacterium]